jgi:ABC-type Zn uptake system ZnuABC Zn-binding protein ZnuA
MKYRFLPVVSLVCLMVLLLWPAMAHAGDKLQVVTTIPDLADITRTIGGPFVQVTALAEGRQNAHFIPARPSLILKLQHADMLVQVGLGLEQWLPPLVDASRNSRIFRGSAGFVDASQGVPLLQIPVGTVDRSMGDLHGAGNPHYWLDPVNAKFISANIVQGLKRVDPVHAAYYDQQRQVFLKQLASRLTTWIQVGKPLKGVRVIAYHNTWPYLEKRFGLDIVGFVEPKPGIAPSPRHIQETIAKVKQHHVQLILMEPYFPRTAPDMIAKATGARVVVIPASVGGVAEASSYFELFDTLLARLTHAL